MLKGVFPAVRVLRCAPEVWQKFGKAAMQSWILKNVWDAADVKRSALLDALI